MTIDDGCEAPTARRLIIPSADGRADEPVATCDWVFAHARRTPDAPAVDSPDCRLSYEILAQRIVAVAGALQRMGVQDRDRVLVAMPNVPAAVVSSLAVQHIGGIAVEVNREWSTDQLASVLPQTRARTVILAGRDAQKFAPLLSASSIRSVVVVHRGPISEELRACFGGVETAFVTEGGELVDAPDGGAPPLHVPPRAPDSVTVVLYTSGSTGRPLGVMQTMTNIAENARSIVSYLELDARDRAMLILPLSYCYGRSVLQTHLFVGGSVFLDNRFTYPRVVLDAIGTERCTGFAGVPLTFELLRRKATPDPSRMTTLRYVTQAGGGMSPDTADWVRAAFHPAKLFVMYGQTEATARLAYLPPDRALDKRGSVGIPIPGVELRVVDDSGNEVSPDAHGHLIARGPNVTPGYYEAPEATAALLRDGWLWTGDVAYRDQDGFVFLVGRAKEIMKISGHRVSPGQIESVLAEHADVAEAVVTGIDDVLTGEAAAALVVAKPGAQVTPEELHRFCTARLPAYLVPRIVRLGSELPRGPSGKVLRAEVARALSLASRDAGAAQQSERAANESTKRAPGTDVKELELVH